MTIVPCLDILGALPALHDRGALDMAVLAPTLDPEQPTGLLFGEGFEQVNEDLVVTSPYTGEPVATVAVGTVEDVSRTADEMREALEADAWARLLGAAAGDAPMVRAYAVGGVVLAGGPGAGDPTTDVEVAAEEAAAEPGEAEPVSTQMHLPLSRPAPPEDEAEAGGAAP